MAAPRLTAADRIRRVLAIVPWIVSNPGVEVAEVARRFDLDPDDLVDDLNVVWMVGIPPYTPDALVEVTIEDGRVWIHYADFFSRPLRLTPDQGLALLASTDGLLSVPGTDPDGPLVRALDKLRTSLGGDGEQIVDVDLGSADPAILATMRDNAASKTEVEIDYFSFNRDTHTTRRITPWRVIAQEGAWYVESWCHVAEAERLFRVDRIEAARPTGTASDKLPVVDATTSSTFSPGSNAARVTIDLSPEAAWVAETYPCERISEGPDGAQRISLAVSARPWLERLLVRLGPRATVVDGEIDGVPAAEVGAEAARRILSRYSG